MSPNLFVVLVAPEIPANIGFVARAMACYGIANLRIVQSPKITEHAEARKTAKGSEFILDSAEYFSDLNLAIADCNYAYGFTRRLRESGQKMESLQTASENWLPVSAKTGLIFGRESQGLSQAETLSLSHLVTIPMCDEKLSLNLSHAVSIALYAFHQKILAHTALCLSQGLSSDPQNAVPPLRLENQLILDQLLHALEDKNFFKGGKDDAQKNYVKQLWQRLNPNQSEFNFLSGLVKKILRN